MLNYSWINCILIIDESIQYFKFEQLLCISSVELSYYNSSNNHPSIRLRLWFVFVFFFVVWGGCCFLLGFFFCFFFCLLLTKLCKIVRIISRTILNYIWRSASNCFFEGPVSSLCRIAHLAEKEYTFHLFLWISITNCFPAEKTFHFE